MIAEAFTPYTLTFGLNGGTSANVDTTGATTLLASLTYYTAVGGVATLSSDSKGNGWTQLTRREANSGHVFYYCIGCTSGTGHNFTITNNGAIIAPALVLHGWTDVVSFDTETGN